MGAGREPGEDSDHRLLAPALARSFLGAEGSWPLFLFAGSTDRCVAVIDLSECFIILLLLFINLFFAFFLSSAYIS